MNLLRLFAAWSLLAVPVPAAAERPGLEAYFAAADRFDALAAAAATRGMPPRRSDPETADVLARLVDAPATFGDSPLGVADLRALLLVAQRSMGIADYYVEFGIDASASSTATLEAQNANAARYQDEIIPLLAFSIETMSVMLPLISTMFEEAQSISDGQRSGAAEIRDGLSGLIHGAIVLAVEGTMRPEHRLPVIAAVVRNSPRLVPSLGLAQREPLRELAMERRVHADLPGRGALDSLIAALASRECNRICALDRIAG